MDIVEFIGLSMSEVEQNFFKHVININKVNCTIELDDAVVGGDICDCLLYFDILDKSKMLMAVIKFERLSKRHLLKMIRRKPIKKIDNYIGLSTYDKYSRKFYTTYVYENLSKNFKSNSV